jgi:hypothetical protein
MKRGGAQRLTCGANRLWPLAKVSAGRRRRSGRFGSTKPNGLCDAATGLTRAQTGSAASVGSLLSGADARDLFTPLREAGILPIRNLPEIIARASDDDLDWVSGESRGVRLLGTLGDGTRPLREDRDRANTRPLDYLRAAHLPDLTRQAIRDQPGKRPSQLPLPPKSRQRSNSTQPASIERSASGTPTPAAGTR